MGISGCYQRGLRRQLCLVQQWLVGSESKWRLPGSVCSVLGAQRRPSLTTNTSRLDPIRMAMSMFELAHDACVCALVGCVSMLGDVGWVG